MSNASKDALISRLKTELQEKNSIIDELKSTIERLQSNLRKPNELRPEYGVNAVSSWVRTTTEMIEVLEGKDLEGEFLLSLTGDELNELLSLFIKNIRKPCGAPYAIDTLYYLMLSLQKYFYQNGKRLNIMYDCNATSDALDEIISNSIKTFLEGVGGIILTRVEEIFLWDNYQLGCYTPEILLATVIYFNIKIFKLRFEDQIRLKFSDISIDSDDSNLYLRWKNKLYEQSIGSVSGYKCPIKHYEFYFHKCPQDARESNSVLLLSPLVSLPESQFWYSAQPMNENELKKIINRFTLIKEVILNISPC